jgi:hypothetical protein
MGVCLNTAYTYHTSLTVSVTNRDQFIVDYFGGNRHGQLVNTICEKDPFIPKLMFWYC